GQANALVGSGPAPAVFPSSAAPGKMEPREKLGRRSLLVTSVAEVKAAIEAALTQVSEGQAAIQAASEKLAEAAQTMAAALEGSGHELVGGVQAALAQAGLELQDGLTATLTAVEQAQTYAAAL